MYPIIKVLSNIRLIKGLWVLVAKSIKLCSFEKGVHTREGPKLTSGFELAIVRKVLWLHWSIPPPTLYCPFNLTMGRKELVSIPLIPFNTSFRINTWREGLGDCLYRFGSTCTDLGGPIRLQNVSDVTCLNSWATRSTSLLEFCSSRYLLKANSIVEKVFGSLKQQKEH